MMDSDGRVSTGSRAEESGWDVGAMDPVVATVRQSDTAAAIDSDGEATKDSDMVTPAVASTPSCQPQAEAELGRMAKTDSDAVLATGLDGNGAKARWNRKWEREDQPEHPEMRRSRHRWRCSWNGAKPPKRD